METREALKPNLDDYLLDHAYDEMFAGPGALGGRVSQDGSGPGVRHTTRPRGPRGAGAGRGT